MLQGHFHQDPVLFTLAIEDFRIEDFVAAVQVGDEFPDAALRVEDLLGFGLSPLVREGNLQALGQKSGLPEPCFQGVVVEDRRLENF